MVGGVVSPPVDTPKTSISRMHKGPVISACIDLIESEADELDATGEYAAIIRQGDFGRAAISKRRSSQSTVAKVV